VWAMSTPPRISTSLLNSPSVRILEGFCIVLMSHPRQSLRFKDASPIIKVDFGHWKTCDAGRFRLGGKRLLICIGSDHLGFLLKEKLRAFLIEQGHTVRDFGSTSEEPVDYPDVAVSVAEAVRAGVADRGILICGTGLGMAIAANKVPGIFAAPVTDVYAARMARQSNNAHIITLGAGTVDFGLARSIVEAWLATEFSGGESARKVAKIVALEERYRSSHVQVPLSEGLQ